MTTLILNSKLVSNPSSHVGYQPVVRSCHSSGPLPSHTGGILGTMYSILIWQVEVEVLGPMPLGTCSTIDRREPRPLWNGAD